MKLSRIFLILILSSLIFQPLFLAKISNADDRSGGSSGGTDEPPNPISSLCKGTGLKLRDCILSIGARIVYLLMYIAIIVSGIFLVWGGILFITEGKADNAKNKVLFAVIGLVVALLSWGIVQLIKGFIEKEQDIL